MMLRSILTALAFASLTACGPHFHGLSVHAVQGQTPDIPIPPDNPAARPDWQGVFIELRSNEGLRAHAARHSSNFIITASLCDSADTTIATLSRWNNLRRTAAWDVAGDLDLDMRVPDAPPPYRYWLGLDTISETSVGRNLTPNPSFEFVDHDLRTATRGVCIHGRGYDWLRGAWHTNVVYIPPELLREAARQGGR